MGHDISQAPNIRQAVWKNRDRRFSPADGINVGGNIWLSRGEYVGFTSLTCHFGSVTGILMKIKLSDEQ